MLVPLCHQTAVLLLCEPTLQRDMSWYILAIIIFSSPNRHENEPIHAFFDFDRFSLLFRNCFTQSEIALQSLRHKSGQQRSPSLNLLLRFQRLLVSQIFPLNVPSKPCEGKSTPFIRCLKRNNLNTRFGKSSEIIFFNLGFFILFVLFLKISINLINNYYRLDLPFVVWFAALFSVKLDL